MSKGESPIQLGRFDLQEVIAERETATVWHGSHRTTETPVAVKILGSENLDRIGGMASFRRSAQAQARLVHPGIAAVYDYGTVEAHDADQSDGRFTAGDPHLIMEYAEEGTLAETWLPQDFEWAREILLSILGSLAHAHAHRIIHRDLKPANVLRFPDRAAGARWKLTDFGFAIQMRDLDIEEMPGTDPSVGTPHYMAPEQLEGWWRHFGPWTDLYQVGCIAYELVCGTTPYQGQTFGEIAAGHLYQSPPALEPRFEVPDGLEAWIHRLMARSPADRFQLAADAARQLGRLAVPETEEVLADGAEEAGSELIEQHRPTVLLGPPLSTQLGSEALSSPGWELPTPFPDELKRPDLEPDAVRLPDAGLSLVGLRERPLANRDEAHDLLWSALDAVVETREPRCVVIDAPSGFGKTHLVESFARRVDEIGICSVLEAQYDHGTGVSEGLSGLVERWAQAWGADREECADLIEMRLGPYGSPDREELSASEDLVDGLSDLLDVEADDRDVGRSSGAASDARFALVERFFERLTVERPLLVVLDDLHRGPESAAFLEWFLDTFDAPPVVIAATTSAEVTETSASTGERIERIRDHRRAEAVELEPLSEDAQYDLVDDLLPLVPRVVEHVVERSEGHPLFAIQLVQDWVERDLLTRTHRGFDFTDEGPPTIADSLVEVWMQRVDESLEELEAEDREAGKEALEIAAVLGRRFDEDELRHALRECDLPFPEPLFEQILVDRGLLEREINGWRFCHRLLVESLETHARRADRLEDHHRLCAEIVAKHGTGRAAGDAERRARHLRESDQTEAALEPLLEAARRYRRNSGLFDRAHELLERRARWVDECRVPETDPRRLDNQIEQAWAFVYRGEPYAARNLADRARSTAESEGRTETAAEAHLLLARIHHDRGELTGVGSHLRQAEARYRELEDAEGMTRCLRFRAQLARQQQRPGDARALFENVRRRYESEGDPLGRAWCDWGIAWAWLDQRELDRAEAVAEPLVEEADALEAPHLLGSAHNLLGEIARSRGDWDRAISHYETSRATWRRIGSKDHLVVELNIGMAQIGTEDWEAAEQTLDSLRYRLEVAGWRQFRPHVTFGLAACAAHRGDWALVDEHFEAMTLAGEAIENPEPDLAELAEVVAEQCLGNDSPDRAGDFFQVAAEIWSDLGRDLQAERLARRASELVE